MSHAILLPNEFEAENVVFLPPKLNKLGGKSVLMNYKDGDKSSPYILQTCRVRAPFGVDQNKQDNGGVKYHISFSLANDYTENEQLKTFTNNIRAVDSVAKQFPQNNESWFDKKLKPEIVDEFYKSAEKFAKDPKWPSTLKAKLPFDRKGVPQFVLYDENKKPIDILDADGNMNTDCIPRGSEAVFLLQPTGVWFVGKTQYGIAYKVVQGKIYKGNKLTGYSIVDEEDEEEEEVVADE